MEEIPLQRHSAVWKSMNGRIAAMPSVFQNPRALAYSIKVIHRISEIVQAKRQYRPALLAAWESTTKSIPGTQREVICYVILRDTWQAPSRKEAQAVLQGLLGKLTK